MRGASICRVGCVPGPKAYPTATSIALIDVDPSFDMRVVIFLDVSRVEWRALDTGTYHSLRAPHANVFSQNTFNMFPPFALHNNQRHLVIIINRKQNKNSQQQQQQPNKAKKKRKHLKKIPIND